MNYQQKIEKYEKYKLKYLNLKNEMFGGVVNPGCCKNDCGRKLNGEKCCDSCNGQNGPHTEECNAKHQKCTTCGVRYGACKGNDQFFSTCCSLCPNHTPICNNRNPIIQTNNVQNTSTSASAIATATANTYPFIIVDVPWGQNSARVIVRNFIYAQPISIGRPPHVDFGGQFPSPGTFFPVSTLHSYTTASGDIVYLRYLLNGVGDKISHPTKKPLSFLHITVYYQKKGDPAPPNLQPPA